MKAKPKLTVVKCTTSSEKLKANQPKNLILNKGNIMFSSKEKMTLDLVLSYAQRHSIMAVRNNEEKVKGCHFPYHNQCIVVDRFAFQVHCHDTGNAVTGYILTDDKPYEIIRATYWKCSGYEHNKDKWEKGTWDKSLEKAIEILKDSVIASQQFQAKIEEGFRIEREKKAAQLKSSVEEMFK